MFGVLERVLAPTAPPDGPEPPAGLTAFYWHFARQAKPLFAALFVAGFAVALLDTTIPLFIGRVVTLVTSARPEMLWTEHWPILVAMAVVLIVMHMAEARHSE